MQRVLTLTDVFSTPVLSRDVKALFLHRLLLRISFGITSAFGIIFYYEYFDDSLIAPLLAYIGVYLIAAVSTPSCARLLSSLGVRGSLIMALPLLFVGTGSLYVLSTGYVPVPPALAIGLSILAAGFYKALYWVPYQVDMALSLSRYEMGRSVAFIANATELIISATPFIGGLLLVAYGYDALFFAGMFFIALSTLPLLPLSERYERYSWSYLGTLRRLFSRRYRGLVSAYFGDGVQSAALTVVWPLMVFLLLSREYMVLGAVTTLTFVAVLALRSLTGSLFDTWEKEKVIFWGSLLSASGWFLKIFVGTPFQIVTVDTYHTFGQVVNRTSMDAITYEQAADNGKYVDEFTALKEVALNIGRVCALAVVAVVAWWGSATLAFFIAMSAAALATLLTARIAERVFVESTGI